MAGRRTSVCHCQSKARQRHIAVSNTTASCLPQSKHRVYSQNLQAFAVAINNQGSCQQPAAFPRPSSTCHHLMLQSHLERPEISTGFIRNKNILYMNQCSCPWFAEQHTWVDWAEHRLSSPTSSLRGVPQRTSICFAASQSRPITEWEGGSLALGISHLWKRAHWECKILWETGGYSVTWEQTPLLLFEGFQLCGSACGQNQAHSFCFASRIWKGVKKGMSGYTLQTFKFPIQTF